MTRQVLLIDDDVNNRELFYYALMDGDYEIHQAESGHDVAVLLRQVSVDLAFIDVELPDTRGTDLARNLRARFPDAVLVVVSVLDDPGVIESAYAAGANAYIVKPFNLQQVLHLLKTLETAERGIHSGMILLRHQQEPDLYSARRPH